MNKVIQSLKKQYSGKNVLVVGLGLQGGGVGVAKFFAELGARVIVSDRKDRERLRPSIDSLREYPIAFHLGGHDLADFLDADVIFKGPFVSWDLTEIVEAQKRNIPIEMELPFFAQYCPCPIIGVTGTRGKSTTTFMIYEVLQKNGFPVHLAGSIPGVSTINLLPKVGKRDWVVMELPSWPLAGFHLKSISPHVAVFTNFYPDHLNFYRSMDQYLLDKKAIYMYQTKKDYLVAGKRLEPVLAKDRIESFVTYVGQEDFPYDFTYIRGLHNKENAAVALAVSRILGIDEKKTAGVLINFKGLPYRQQILGNKRNVYFVNDTTSTTPVATMKAIESFMPEKIVLMLGGNSKGLPHAKLLEHLKQVEYVVLLKGSFTDEILPYLKKLYPDKYTDVYDDLTRATDKAYELARQSHKSVYVLFSPGATSFSMFNNEFHRGESFTRIVQKIIGHAR